MLRHPLLYGILEFLPLTAFVTAGRLGSALPERFFWGVAVMVLTLPILLRAGRRLNPLLIAANVWLCAEAATFVFDTPLVGSVRRGLKESSFFLAVLVVGAAFAVFSQRGLLTVDHAKARHWSLALLAVALGGYLCALSFRGNELLAATLPATILFVSQTLIHLRLERSR